MLHVIVMARVNKNKNTIKGLVPIKLPFEGVLCTEAL